MRLFACALLGAMTTALPATAANLRYMSTLNGPTVRLSDLFDDAGPNAGRVLGPGPAPGGRIVVEAPQLAAIARQFDVDWRPASPGDRTILERPGRVLSREEVVRALRQALHDAGAPQDAELELSGFTPPTVPVDTTSKPSVEQLDYDAASGRFSARVGVAVDGEAPVFAQLAGRLVAMMDVPVPVRRLMPGEAIGATDLRIAHVRMTEAGAAVVQTAAQAIGMSPRRQLAAGSPFTIADLQQAALVHRGDPVTVLLDGPGLAVTATGEAMETGGAGTRIRVLNPASRAVLEAEIVGADQVRVMPGAAPIVPARQKRIAAR